MTVPSDPEAEARAAQARRDEYSEPAEKAPVPQPPGVDPTAMEAARFNGSKPVPPGTGPNEVPEEMLGNSKYPCDRAHRCDASKKVL